MYKRDNDVMTVTVRIEVIGEYPDGGDNKCRIFESRTYTMLRGDIQRLSFSEILDELFHDAVERCE